MGVKSSDEATRRPSRCCCGALKAVCEGEPARVLLCNCTECQRRTGSIFGVAAYYPQSQVLIAGLPKTYRRASDSGRSLAFYFCDTCRTTVFLELEAFPRMYGVAAGAFADPGFIAPQLSVWTQHQHEWVHLPDDVERLPQGAVRAKT